MNRPQISDKNVKKDNEDFFDCFPPIEFLKPSGVVNLPKNTENGENLNDVFLDPPVERRIQSLIVRKPRKFSGYILMEPITKKIISTPASPSSSSPLREVNNINISSDGKQNLNANMENSLQNLENKSPSSRKKIFQKIRRFFQLNKRDNSPKNDKHRKKESCTNFTKTMNIFRKKEKS